MSSSTKKKRTSRWDTSNENMSAAPIIIPNDDQTASSSSSISSVVVTEEEAVQALLAESSAATAAATKKRDYDNKRRRWDNDSRKRPRNQKNRWGDKTKKDDDYYGPSKTDRSRKTGDNEEGKYSWGKKEKNEKKEEPKKEKVKPDFGVSGALAKDESTGNSYNGVVLRFTEPPEARTPNTHWRLYVFRRKNQQQPQHKKDKKDDDDLLSVLHISRQSAYLFGRDHRVADIPVDHASLSKQHCVLQYRAVPDDKSGGGGDLRCKPYLMDLESTNGTFLNGTRLESARYYELRRGDVIRIGGSSREYVLLTEHTTKLGV